MRSIHCPLVIGLMRPNGRPVRNPGPSVQRRQTSQHIKQILLNVITPPPLSRNRFSAGTRPHTPTPTHILHAHILSQRGRIAGAAIVRSNCVCNVIKTAECRLFLNHFMFWMFAAQCTAFEWDYSVRCAGVRSVSEIDCEPVLVGVCVCVGGSVAR